MGGGKGLTFLRRGRAVDVVGALQVIEQRRPTHRRGSRCKWEAEGAPGGSVASRQQVPGSAANTAATLPSPSPSDPLLLLCILLGLRARGHTGAVAEGMGRAEVAGGAIGSGRLGGGVGRDEELRGGGSRRRRVDMVQRRWEGGGATVRSRERTGGRRADVAGDDAVGDVAMGGTEEVEGGGLRSGVVVSIWICEMRENK